MNTSDLDFHLPPDLIAQTPPSERTASRLLHYRRSDKSLSHHTFADLPSLLHPGDLLVFNDSRVLPAKILLHKPTGGRVEGLFLSEESPSTWRVLLKNLGPPRPSTPTRSTGVPPVLTTADHPESSPSPSSFILHPSSFPVLSFADAPHITMTVQERILEGEYRVQISDPTPAPTLLTRLGRMPLPPYIKRAKDHDPLDDLDRDRYQTTYANLPGSVAAPTAGLHFTPELLDQLKSRGVQTTSVTLHVGVGTFKPVTTDTLESHPMHTESYTISPEAAATINRAKQDRRRIIAVGTTAARVLESQPEGPLSPRSADTSIFIYPPYTWKHVTALITNFHLPKSTLIALVAAFTTLPEQRRIYAQAISHHYRFFSYGDTSFLE